MFLPYALARRLELIAVGQIDTELLEGLGSELDRRFGTTSRRTGFLPLRDEWVDLERGQYCSNRIVDTLTTELIAPVADPGTRWLLAVVAVDLYAPGRTFVFGEATLGGCCAVISLVRLRPSAQRTILDPVLFHERVLKEATHELGHVAGLEHCITTDCVMAESFDVDDIDRKGSYFCTLCTAKLPLPRTGGRG